jgi:hypothetical protein
MSMVDAVRPSCRNTGFAPAPAVVRRSARTAHVSVLPGIDFRQALNHQFEQIRQIVGIEGRMTKILQRRAAL